ncbi:MAG TPA: J domain-containing protein [Polyangia bacterium]|nr:J domain-containing protein [Polyangia bacterium]
MSIGKRLIDLARSELNSLLDRASHHEEVHFGERDPDHDLYERYGMSTISDEELEAELERRRAAREAAAKATRARAEAPRPRPSAKPQSPPPQRASHADEIRRAYASLEVPPGSDFETVRKAYRTLMRKYHPDRHAQTPEKQKAATELAQKLTQAYKLLEKQLRK